MQQEHNQRKLQLNSKCGIKTRTLTYNYFYLFSCEEKNWIVVWFNNKFIDVSTSFVALVIYHSNNQKTRQHPHVSKQTRFVRKWYFSWMIILEMLANAICHCSGFVRVPQKINESRVFRYVCPWWTRRSQRRMRRRELHIHSYYTCYRGFFRWHIYL